MSTKGPVTIDLERGEWKETSKKETDMSKSNWLYIVVVLVIVAGASFAVGRLGGGKGVPTLSQKEQSAATQASASPETRLGTLEKGQEETQRTLADIAAYLKKGPPKDDPAAQRGPDESEGPMDRGSARRGETPAEVAAQAYQSLGPPPTNTPLKNHQKVSKKGSRSFTCPDGSPGELIKSVTEDGHGKGHTRWYCP